MRKWKGDIVFLVVIATLVGGWMYLYPSPSAGPLSPLDTPLDLHTEEPLSYASQEGLKLAYRLYAPPDDATHVLVFLHDTLLHSGWYDRLGRDLAARGIAVYLPDRRGWGHSAGDRRKRARDQSVLTEDIRAMIAVAQSSYPQIRVFLGGHGRGAGLVMQYVASRRPVPGVIMISPHISDDQPNLNAEGWREFVTAHPGEAYLARAGLTYWRVWHYNWPEPMIEADPLIETRSSPSWLQETVPDDVEDAYSALTVPLLCVQGGDDPLYHPDRTTELVDSFDTSNRQLETLPGADYLGVIASAANPIADWLAGG